MSFIFDMGNVLSLDVDVLPPIAERLGLTIEEIVNFAGDDFDELLTGSISADEMWERFNAHFGTDVREDLLLTLFHPVIDQRVWQLILELKAGGHRVVCGTNSFERHYLYHLERGEYAVFDRVYASHIIKVAKPAVAFFRHILSEEGWRAADTYFVDDRPANVAAAASLGMHALLYESYEGLREWLDGKLPAPQARGEGEP